MVWVKRHGRVLIGHGRHVIWSKDDAFVVVAAPE